MEPEGTCAAHRAPHVVQVETGIGNDCRRGMSTAMADSGVEVDMGSRVSSVYLVQA